MTNEEEEEVRSLLSRHRKRITTDLAKTNLIKVLVENSVLNASQEKLFDSATNKDDEKKDDVKNDFCKNENDSFNDNLCVEMKCSQLIELISKNGFEKFKQFCYAIENECPELIEDLINDRLKYDTANLNTTLIKKQDAADQIIRADDDEDLKEAERSRRATSYGGTITDVPVPAPRRASISSLTTPPTSTVSPSPLISNLIEASIAPKEDLITNVYQNPSIGPTNYSSLLCHTTSDPTPATTGRKKEKLLHRLSDAATLGRRLKKKKNTNRTCQSMTDAIEILGDQVIEDEFFGDRTTWEFHTVPVTRVPGYGFGIAVSGGRDNPHFANGDPSIAVSDVLKGGPAEDRLQVNDRIISVNGVSLDNVEYATAVQVLRDSGNTVTLVVKRRVSNMSSMHQHSHSLSSAGLMGSGLVQANTNMGPPPLPTPLTSQQPIKVVLTKASKKEDFGVVLGCRLFIKEISSKARDQLNANGYTLQEGDVITRIHNTNCNDTMSMKEAKKIIDNCKERLNLVVMRDITNQSNGLSNNNLNNSAQHNPPYAHTAQLSSCSNNLDEAFLSGNNYSTQNLYVQPPTRGGSSGVGGIVGGVMGDEKSNLTPRGRSRGPLMDVSLSQLDRPSTPPGGISNRRSLNPDEPPRPPPPRTEEFYSSRRQLYEDDPLQRSRQSAEPRFISFQKEGSVGIRLTGGNEAGIFVTAVQPGSPASLQGLTPGDKILKVNDMDMHGVTREEAVLFLLSLQDRIDLIVQHCKDEYEEAVANQRGDSFHIKTHFHCENPSKGEMAFKAGDVFRVIDTLHNGVVGSWQVLKIGRSHQEMQRGVIPNKARAEELATAQFNATKKEMNASESRGNFFRRRRSTHRRSKSLSRENWDDVVFSDSISKFPAYERVVLRHPGFVRPVVLFGPVADIAREKLIKDFPDKFTVPLQDDDKSNSKCRIVRLSNIRDIMDRGKHALLDITPNAVDRLNYAQFYPIVIFLKSDTKHTIKQLRHDVPKSAHKSSKKLLEQCQKLDRVWSHIFSITIMLNDVDSWYRKLREAIDLQQSGAVWMSESKPVESLSDDFLFPMTTSRLSYASSPESDLELSPGPSASLSLGNLPQLVKSSSDPSIATNQDNLDRDRDIGEGLPPPYTHSYEPTSGSHNRRSTMDSKYAFAPTDQNIPPTIPNSNRPQSIYGINAPDLPPRVDRASKPPGGPPVPNSSVTNTPTRSSSGGTVGRSAQERLFGKQLAEEAQDEYVTRNSTDPAERAQSSLDRQRMSSGPNNPPLNKVLPTNPQNGSYDSVSSYDSYNTTQLSVQNIRLGPNAPDDLKSVPSVNGRPPPPLTAGLNVMNESRTSINDTSTPNRNSLHEHSRVVHDHQGRPIAATAGDMNRQNSPGRPPYMETQRNIDSRNPPNPHDIRSPQGNLPQRPGNIGLEGSPRKHVVETKTDYGKYSRNNSTSQADYTKIPKSPNMGVQNSNCIGMGTNGNGGGGGGVGGAFKPVPPPKPKNYRPPVQGQMNPAGHWDNGESNSPRSPNGFFYPPTPSHYHQSQSSQATTHSTSNNNAANQPIHAYGHYNAGQAPPYPTPANGYNGNGGHGYSGQYVHRGHPSMGNYSHHTPERHTLDLAGSREQRGSAFELYRKPQIGSTGHHHNMSDMEPPYERYYNQLQQPQRPSFYMNQMNQMDQMNQMNQMNHMNQMESRYYGYYTNENPPPLPPLLPQLKVKKKSMLKSPLSVLKNVFIKSTRPLRRMNSMVEPERVAKPALRRQYSMMERNVTRPPPPHSHHHQYPPPIQYIPVEVPIQTQKSLHEPFYPRDLNNTYQNLETEDIYAMNGQTTTYQQQEYCDNLYANRALIDLERREAEVRQGGRRIIRRHSMADRTNGNRQRYISSPQYDAEYTYQREEFSVHDQRPPGSAVMSRRRIYSDRSEESIYQSRREMHRNHLYQSKREMQERIAQGKREIEREFSPQSSSISADERDDKSDRESSVSFSRKDIKENGLRVKQQQLREQIYQTRREAIESMAEPIYVTKKDVKHEPIYETKEECLTASKESVQDDIRDQNDNTTNNTLSDTKSSDVHRSDETVIENTITPNAVQTDNEVLSTSSVTPHRDPYHLSSIIKRTAPPPPPPQIHASRTSIETQYTSQASLPVGPPNATSTPYASEMSIPANGVIAKTPQLDSINEPATTRGIFDDRGGRLRDDVWNVSLEIPPGAIPAGVKQEIYFTVTDPRMSESVGGPPLDMENGETMLSPLVMCGPQGLEFLVPVTLNIPHCAGRTASLGLALKATDSEHNLQTNWDNIDLPSNASAHTVSVKVDHF